jgi:hypothetical protein
LLLKWLENNIKLQKILQDHPLSRGIKIRHVDVEKALKSFI